MQIHEFVHMKKEEIIGADSDYGFGNGYGFGEGSGFGYGHDIKRIRL